MSGQNDDFSPSPEMEAKKASDFASEKERAKKAKKLGGGFKKGFLGGDREPTKKKTATQAPSSSTSSIPPMPLASICKSETLLQDNETSASSEQEATEEENEESLSLDIANKQASELNLYMEQLKTRRIQEDEQAIINEYSTRHGCIKEASGGVANVLDMIAAMNARSIEAHGQDDQDLLCSSGSTDHPSDYKLDDNYYGVNHEAKSASEKLRSGVSRRMQAGNTDDEDADGFFDDESDDEECYSPVQNSSRVTQQKSPQNRSPRQEEPRTTGFQSVFGCAELLKDSE